MSTDYQQIYQTQAAEYEHLVAAEDVDGNVLRAIQAVVEVAGETGLEVGVGTGRITRQLVMAGGRIIGVEPAVPMLDIAREILATCGPGSATLHEGSASKLPFDNDVASYAVAGWVFGHQRHWSSDWRSDIGRGIDEMRRVVRPGGKVLIFETLGTGSEEPMPPNSELAEYYDWLERAGGFARTAFRTDYSFASWQDAAATMKFFFGDRLVEKIQQNQWNRVPECTGLWTTTT